MAVLMIIALAALFVALGAYARHDRFAGPRNKHLEVDDLGAVPDRNLVRF